MTTRRVTRVQRLINALLPCLTPGDVVAILKDRELFPRLHPDLGAQPLTELGELTVIVLIMKTDVGHERGRLAWHETPLPLTCNKTARRAIRSGRM